MDITSSPPQLLALILSDVIGDPLDVIASGPTVPNTTPTQEVLRTIDNYGVREAMPNSIIHHLQHTHTTPISHPLVEQVFRKVQNVIIGNNQTATSAAAERARELGYTTYVWSHRVQGEARTIGELYARVAMALVSSSPCPTSSLSPDGFCATPGLAEDLERLCSSLPSLCPHLPLCIIGAGEPTVMLRGAGRGGRSQELALAVAVWLDRLVGGKPLGVMPHDIIQFLSAGTDGEDGPCDAAGGIVGVGVVRKAGDQGIDPQAHLDDNDSYGFFSKLCEGICHIRTGLTGTNVMDVHVLCINMALP